MPISFFSAYSRTIAASAAILLTIWLFYDGPGSDLHGSLYGFFEWLETTWFGVIGKTWGAAFAFVEAIHLLALAVLGGSVIAGDGRLLGLVLTDLPARTVIDRTHQLLVWALAVLLFTGVFMACGVALKVYYLEVFWFKMLALGAGMLFHFFIRKPLLQHDLADLNPVIVNLTAISSALVWFLVAAAGRWIGFSG